MIIALTAKQLFTPLECIEDPVVLIEDGRICAAGPRTAIEVPQGSSHHDFSGNILAPGFIDIHIHGNAGHDVMEGSETALTAVGESLARHGVTSYLPTTVTAPLDRTLSSLASLGKAIGRKMDGKWHARPLGIHLEGPFLSHAKRGVHPPARLLEPRIDTFEQFWNAAEGRVAMMTIAPELPGATDLIRHATARGVLSSLGHSNANLAESLGGVEAGAVHATHTFNAMRALDHREPGILGVALMSDGLTADIIADGIHVDPMILRLFLKAKGEERAILITDAISATGMPDGHYQLGDIEVEVRNGRCEHDGKLAGSVLTLDVAVRNTMKFAGWKLQRAIRLATHNPARLLGCEQSKGQIAVGCDADILVLSPEGKILQTMISGRFA